MAEPAQVHVGWLKKSLGVPEDKHLVPRYQPVEEKKMAAGNPSVTDDETGEHFAFDESGFAKFKDKYHHVGMDVSPDAFRVLVEATCTSATMR